MPNVTMFIASDRMPADDALAELTLQCTRLCTDVLQASLENVHILYVAVKQGRGHPAYAEINYRIEPLRTQPLMNTFLDGLEHAIRHATGLSARIRCFGHAATDIHARN